MAALNSQPDIDLILLVRGGGSLEDLWCFNDERVARAVADSRIPLIAGVGHEIDFTLADFAADLRAPTPSAAAELATPITIDDLAATVDALRRQLGSRLQEAVDSHRRRLSDAQVGLRQTSPRGRIDNLRQRIDSQVSRIRQAARASIALKRASLVGVQRALEGVSPARTLARGYAIVQGADGRVLRNAADSALGDRLNIRLSRGQIQATVTGQETNHE